MIENEGFPSDDLSLAALADKPKAELLVFAENFSARQINSLIVRLREIAGFHRQIAWRMSEAERILSDEVRRRAEITELD